MSSIPISNKQYLCERTKWVITPGNNSSPLEVIVIKRRYLIKHVSTETLTNGRMIPSGTNRNTNIDI